MWEKKDEGKVERKTRLEYVREEFDCREGQ